MARRRTVLVLWVLAFVSAVQIPVHADIYDTESQIGTNDISVRHLGPNAARCKLGCAGL